MTELRVAKAEPVTLKDAESDHILRVLEESDGVVAHAAMRLGLPRTALLYKMRRLGIELPRAQSISNGQSLARPRHNPARYAT